MLGNCYKRPASVVGAAFETVVAATVCHVEYARYTASLLDAILQSFAECVTPATPLHAAWIRSKLPTVTKVPGRNVYVLVNRCATCHSGKPSCLALYKKNGLSQEHSGCDSARPVNPHHLPEG